MAHCTYCSSGEVIWVPTTEGVRPFQSVYTVSPDAPVVVLDRHDCEERKEALKASQEEFARHLAMDPIIAAKALEIACPACQAWVGGACYDLRKGSAPGKTNKHSHQPRLIAAARSLQT